MVEAWSGKNMAEGRLTTRLVVTLLGGFWVVKAGRLLFVVVPALVVLVLALDKLLVGLDLAVGVNVIRFGLVVLALVEADGDPDAEVVSSEPLFVDTKIPSSAAVVGDVAMVVATGLVVVFNPPARVEPVDELVLGLLVGAFVLPV